ncbi:hypothetical protein [Candidatus Enterococcus clewellii]|uniref:ABC3 transporter permease protein domain-containing protein n=1 Tax=Candidatus Enterococcus clewellii TaxID=1834193 RepID=A0A242KCN5_9ENTE|nr:hypothetical protein [Enterococcus sp. 9E7_DIV0242]OTP18548.1 hypothetical protein A5888_000362 [Enterococcus sp. 9E7_DIV0242]
MLTEVSMILYYTVTSSFRSLVRRRGYFSSFIMIGLLFFLFFFSWKWVDFFSSWIILETVLQEMAKEDEAASFQPLILLLTILRTGTILVCFFLFLAVILYTKHFYKQKAGIEQEEIVIKRLLGERSAIIASEFVLEAGYILVFFGSISLVLSTIIFKKLLRDIQVLGAFQNVVERFDPHHGIEFLLFLVVICLTLLSIFYTVYRQADREALASPSSTNSGDKEED